MKTLLLLLLPLLLCINYNSFSQIILEESSLDNTINQYYTETTTYPTTFAKVLGQPDNGTKIYSVIPNPDPTTLTLYIVRKQNKWQIEYGYQYNSGFQIILFRQVNTSNSTFLDCDKDYIWEKWINNDSGNRIPSGIIDSTLKISGMCRKENTNSSSSEILPNQINIPTLSTEEINAIKNPKVGSIIYDKDENTLKVYNYMGWNSFNLIADDDYLPKFNFYGLSMSTRFGGIAQPGISFIKSIQKGDYIYAIFQISYPINGGFISLNGNISDIVSSHQIVQFDKNLNAKILPFSGYDFDVYENTLYVLINIKSPTIINGTTFYPTDAESSVIVSYNMINNSTNYAHLVTSLPTEKITHIMADYSNVYLSGYFKNNGNDNSFIKKLTASNGNLNQITRFISSYNNKITNLINHNSKIYVLGFTHGNYTIVGPTNTLNSNHNFSKRLFLNRLDQYNLNPDPTYTLNLHDEFQNNNLEIKSFEIHNSVKSGTIQESIRFAINPNSLISNIGNKKAHAGSYIFGIDLNNSSRIIYNEPFNYMSILNLKNNHILGYANNTILKFNSGRIHQKNSNTFLWGKVNSKGQIDKFIFNYNGYPLSSSINNFHELENNIIIMGSTSTGIFWSGKQYNGGHTGAPSIWALKGNLD